MGLMDRMMKQMVGTMSAEEKEAMMLNMMPEMMKHVDVNEMIPNMIATMGGLVSVAGIAAFLSRAYKDDEIRGHLKEISRDLPALSRKMANLMPMMKGLMSQIMEAKMKVMGNVMPIMMPMMLQIMPAMMKEIMPEVVAENQAMQEMMPQMMSEVMPHCLGAFMPFMEEDQREDFVSRIRTAIDSSETDKRHLLA